MVIKAVGLFSGGLDSLLAVKILQEQGIEITGLHFRTGFSYEARRRMLGKGEADSSTSVEYLADSIGLRLEILPVSEAYIPVVVNPRYGYGSGMNPCVDCRIFLLRQAKAWMEAHDYHFVFTGEVVGQRPKSQMRPTLNTVERESGLSGYLLRPLSARLLPPTIPEQRGWVDREQLYDISGRGRKRQITLAEQLGIAEYQQPAGGCCYLIDRTYARRLEDFLSVEGDEALTPDLAQLLAVGRHLRLPAGQKLIVGRDEYENAYLASSEAADVCLWTVDHPGPTTLLLGAPTSEAVTLAAQVTAGYSDGKYETRVRVEVKRADGDLEGLMVKPMARDAIKRMMI